MTAKHEIELMLDHGEIAAAVNGSAQTKMVCRFKFGPFTMPLAERVEGTTAEALINQALALNFCPFRSPDWKQLVSPKESIEFSQPRWARVLEIVEP